MSKPTISGQSATLNPCQPDPSFFEPPKSHGESQQTAAAVPVAAPSSSANVAGKETPVRSAPFVATDTASWLPPGWLVEDRVRSSGVTAGTVDKYYIEPTTGRRFRSKKEVQYYLETGTVRKRKRSTENCDGDVNAAGTSRGHHNKETGTDTDNFHLNFDYDNVPESVEWALTDANQDAWTPSIGGQKVVDCEKRQWEAAFAFKVSMR